MSEDTIRVGTIRKLPDGSFGGHLQRVYAGHGRSAVWRHLTEPGALAQWLAPGTIELRPGGAVHIDFADSGTVIDSSVLEYADGEVLAYSWSSGSEPARPLRWALDDAEGGTRLSLTVTIPAGEDPAKACAGFEGHLEMLAGALEGVSIRFPFDLFLAARAAYTAQLAD